MPAFVTVFDYARDGWRDLYVIPFSIVMTAIMYFCCRYQIYPNLEFMSLGRLRRLVAYVPLIVIGGSLLASCATNIWTYVVLRHALSTGSFGMANGEIEDYRPWIPHQSGELFFVNGIEFSMWDSRSQAFDDMPIQLHDGQRVRISYVGNAIVRFQIEAP